MTTCLKMLPLSLEHDGTMWWRVDDLWWVSLLEAFLAWLALHLELFMSFLSPRLHSSFSLFCHAIFLFFLLWILAFCLDLLLHSLFHPYKRLVDNTYLKGCIYRFWRNSSVVIELKVIFYATTKLVLTF